MVQPKGVVNLGEFWEEWSRCITFKHQRDQLYRVGRFDDCTVQWRDYTRAIEAKFTNDADKARVMIEGTHLCRTKGVSSTLGVIWQAKQVPSWD